MLDQTALALARGGHPEPLTNALLESFAIHVRALQHFFFGAAPRSTDVVVSDFLPAPNPWLAQINAGGIPAPLEGIHQRVKREIAHLTYDRLSVQPAAKQWDVTSIHATLMALVQRFVAAAPSAYLDAARWRPYGSPTYLVPSPLSATNVTQIAATSTTTQPHVLVSSPSGNKLQ